MSKGVVERFYLIINGDTCYTRLVWDIAPYHHHNTKLSYGVSKARYTAK